MEDLNDKITGNNLAANEWNQPASEIQNVIESLGIVLSGADLNQLGKAIAGYTANGNFYTDGGAADAYVLTKIGLKQTLPEYTDGMEVEFLAGNTNTGASTVNVAGLGVKNIVNTGTAGTITAGARIGLRYRSGSGDFEIVRFLTANTVGVPELQISQWGGEYIKLSHVETSGTAAGGFTSGSWQTRILNTEDFDTGGHASLAANQFTLDAGTYQVEAKAIGHFCNLHKIKLYNTSDASDVIIGDNAYSATAGDEQSVSSLFGQFTIAASKTFELQHRCSTTKTVDGFGRAVTFGVSEVYATVVLRKVI